MRYLHIIKHEKNILLKRGGNNYATIINKFNLGKLSIETNSSIIFPIISSLDTFLYYCLYLLFLFAFNYGRI